MKLDLVGKRIVRVRSITKKELEEMGWEDYEHYKTPVIELEGGYKLFSSMDEEANGPGQLFGIKDEIPFIVLVKTRKVKK
jgi:hypothetical protein